VISDAGKHTADEWGHILADIADMMDYQSRRMQIEKWIAVKIQVKKAPRKRKK
jgi:hypothetical protein